MYSVLCLYNFHSFLSIQGKYYGRSYHFTKPTSIKKVYHCNYFSKVSIITLLQVLEVEDDEEDEPVFEPEIIVETWEQKAEQLVSFLISNLIFK